MYKIAENIGKKISYGHGKKINIQPCECDYCSQPAIELVKGEQDSYGWEPVFLCNDCLGQNSGLYDNIKVIYGNCDGISFKNIEFLGQARDFAKNQDWAFIPYIEQGYGEVPAWIS